MVSPSFSVVINTNGRLDFLKRTLLGLRYLNYSNFEVCVVCGPALDGTKEYLDSQGAGLKIGHCLQRNLSESRNIGIAMAAGDVVAFIDDDSVPEAEWLSDLAVAYQDDDVAAAGGFVYDTTGVTFQARYVTTNRAAYADSHWTGPVGHLNFPGSLDYPHLLGTNCSFRRDVLLELGGFDEEFDYFLDETDLCCRLNDAGYKIVQLDNAFVHHKFAPSFMRDVNRRVSYWYPLIKNRVYFGMRNARGNSSVREILASGLADADIWDRNLQAAVNEGLHTAEDLDRFRGEADQGIIDGFGRGLQPKRKLLQRQTVDAFQRPFLPASVLLQCDRLVICLVSQDYPPNQNGGIARNVSQLARSLAQAGHHVHVLTRTQNTATLDFEGGVWVHRLLITPFDVPRPSPIEPMQVPHHIWSYSKTMLDVVKEIDQRRKVDLVYCPLWDCEPIAFVLDGSTPVLCALQTTMKFWLESQTAKAADPAWMSRYGLPIMALESFIVDHATLLHANSRAILRDIRERYALELADERVFVSPHGMEDWNAADDAPSSGMERSDGLHLVFIGRLESRKGIDLLLNAAPRLLARFDTLTIHIVGDDTILKPDGSTYKAEFLARHWPAGIVERVKFHGRVDEDSLRSFYRGCDVFVAPSRYESFGLVFLEAMMFGKPVVGCDAGGVSEVVTDGVTGLLVPPNDVEALEVAITRLLVDDDMRASFGRAARHEYERRFTDAAMLADFLAMTSKAKARARATAADVSVSSRAGLHRLPTP